MQHDFVFVVSGGRTGTKYFGQLMSEMIDGACSVHDPDVAALKETKRLFWALKTFGLWHMVFGRILGRTGIRPLATQRLRGEIDGQQAQASIHKQRDKFYAGLDSQLIVESNAMWFGLLPDLRAVYPEARVIGIIRDPRDWVTSWLNYGGHHDKWDLPALFGQTRLSPADTGETELAARWETASTFEKICWDWTMINSRIIEAEAQDPLIRIWTFEDLFHGDSDAPMQALLSYAAEQPSRSYPIRFDPAKRAERRNASRGKAPGWRDWTPDQARMLEAHCGPLMRRFGYGNEPEWQEKLRQAA